LQALLPKTPIPKLWQLSSFSSSRLQLSLHAFKVSSVRERAKGLKAAAATRFSSIKACRDLYFML
jgi:hypothetical protein